MSIQLTVFVITPYTIKSETSYFVIASSIDEATAIATASGLGSFVVEVDQVFSTALPFIETCTAESE